MADPTIFGAILAGGAGRRIGGDKALVDLTGAPLVARVARALSGNIRALAIVGDERAARAVNAEALSDFPGAARGPLSGVHAALAWAAARGGAYLAVAPCDTPFLPDDVVARLLDAVLAAHAPIAAARGGSGVHPLVSLWRTDLAPVLGEALRDGAHPPVQRFIADLGCAYLALPDAALANINTPDELEAARTRLEHGAQ